MKLSIIFLLMMALFFQAHSEDENTNNNKINDKSPDKNSREDLDQLIEEKQYLQAYDLGENLLVEYEGDSEFDFQYGLAAIETAHYDQALFAFERLILLKANQPRYRLELARTHFFLNNLARAQIEFERVLSQKPPKAVQQNVKDFLRKITQLQNRVKPKFMASVDMAAGFDSNINSAPDANFLPANELSFSDTNISLNDNSQETESGFFSSLFNIAYLAPLTNSSSYDVRLLGSSKFNTEISTYDLSSLMGELGYSFYNRHTGPIKWRTAGRTQAVLLDGETFLNTHTLVAQGFMEHPSGINLGLSVNLGVATYDNNDDGDLTQAQFNVSASSPPQKHSWVAAFILGSDSADEEVNDFNAKGYYGLTLQSTHLFGNRNSAYLLLSFIETEYDEINVALYQVLREDSVMNAGFGWRRIINKNLSLRNDYSWNDADSTLEANTYQRLKTEFGLSYSF